MDNFDDAEHGLGGILAFDAAEATDENPGRAAARALVRARARGVPAGTGLVPGHRGPRISSHCSRSRLVKPSGVTSCPGAFSSRKPMMRPDVSTA
ncbi:hypothetical protein ABZ719_21955 [Streptomyces sp. NPDC006743]|uniref:hypothetical protein n=1 Tax=Streptomyces sp. NPDC006743 TaxID=3154480 RepID=UPI003452C526